MEKELEAVVNAYYKEWLKTNDPYEDDFEGELKTLGIDQWFTLNFNPSGFNEWILIG